MPMSDLKRRGAQIRFQVRNTVMAAVLRKTDYSRWGDERQLYTGWEPRSQRAAALVPPNSRVIEFGAGNRTFERHLDPSCTYVPSDIVDRGPGTVIYDLNRRPLPELGAGTFDVAVLMGVLEYIRDVPSVIDWLAQNVQVCVVSYVCAGATSHASRGMRESAGRVGLGWLNHYSEPEFRSLFLERGFVSELEENWEDNRLFVFHTKPIDAP